MTVQPAAESTTLIELDVWADLVCPWSWIAKRRIEAAIHAFERPHDVTVRLRAYELDPEWPARRNEPVPDRIGSRPDEEAEAERALRAHAHEVAEADDLVFDLDSAVTANSFDAHRLVALARELGGPALQSAAVERFFSAHFREGLPLDEPEVLQRLGAECGLDERRVAAVLASDHYSGEVRADEKQARDLGITATPFVLANGFAAVPGTRPVEEYLALLRGVAVQGGDRA
ncbi:DsbA family oxidoreductase [Intrasporangium sp. YIM S08009]|uniref:DsbA family oxidoreductase n=1 Tax=Intrasporangium zincisolvens TaxID=3080018 RepID=UPI002B0618E7|nr:DsbA family oxidoreductase [Intrasporangium sp. YIM S08009]